MTYNDNSKQIEGFVIQFLTEHPDFFCYHASLFCKLQLPRQRKNDERSLIELQNENLRSALTTLELKEEELLLREKKMTQTGQQEKIFELADDLLSCSEEVEYPAIALNFFKKHFAVKQGAIRLWGVKPNFSFLPFAEPLSQNVQAAIEAMPDIYAGPNEGPQIASWLHIPVEDTQSVLLAPLKNKRNKVCGMLCLTSDSPRTFSQADVDVFLLTSLKLTEAALARLMN